MRRSSLWTAALLALVACTQSSPTVAPPSSSPSPSVGSPSPAPPPPILAPLTGLRVKSAAILDRPALAVKIDNHTDARPHVGLNSADIVYEEPVEGGITRFIAIFHSRDATKVGPVRSARLTDLDVLVEYNRPLLAFSGAAGYVLRAMRKANLVSLSHGGNASAYRRDASRSAPHNLFTSTKDLWRIGARRHARPASQKWGFGALAGAWPRGRRAIIPFGGAYTADWRYDSRTGKYLRFNGRIAVQNVLVMRVTLQKRSEAAAQHGTPELALVGSGEAVLLRDGVRIVGRWSRARLGASTRFTDSLGRPIVFKPGTTWIELVPTKIVPRYR